MGDVPRLCKAIRKAIPYIDHHSSCRYNKVDTPDGDFCTCNVGSIISELRFALEVNEEG